ncbi:MAG: hypothetical protein ACI828_001298 [Flavobacteriales bacterium]|jgi:hypothetical protein
MFLFPFAVSFAVQPKIDLYLKIAVSVSELLIIITAAFIDGHIKKMRTFSAL